jgi:hypothetical protein
MQMTSYVIVKQRANNYLLECLSGPCRIGDQTIKDIQESSLAKVLTTLGVPAEQMMAAIEEARVLGRANVTYEAKRTDPL